MLESIYLTKSKVRGKLLGVLFSNPEKRYYLSELARQVHASIGNVQRELERFVKDELLRREKQGNLVFYIVNNSHALFPEIRSLVLKTVGIEGELRNLAEKSGKEIKLMIIYGSFARGEEHGESDIDILVVADERLENFYSKLTHLQTRFSREINPVSYSSSEFKKKIEEKNTFVVNVLKNPYKVLKGNLNEFQKTTTGRSGKKN